MKQSRLLIAVAGIALAAAGSSAILRQAALAMSPCTKTIAERNAAFDAERSSRRALDAARRELADANTSDPKRIDKVLADTLSEIQADRTTISVLERNDEVPGFLALAKASLQKAQARLEFYQAKQTQILAGDMVTIQPPAGYVTDLKTRVADLDAKHAQLEKRLVELDRDVAACRANTGGPAVGGQWVFTVSYSSPHAFETVWDLGLDGPDTGPWHGTAVAEPGPVAPGTKMNCSAARGSDGKVVIRCGSESYCPGAPEGHGFAGQCSGYNWTLRKR